MRICSHKHHHYERVRPLLTGKGLLTSNRRYNGFSRALKTIREALVHHCTRLEIDESEAMHRTDSQRLPMGFKCHSRYSRRWVKLDQLAKAKRWSRCGTGLEGAFNGLMEGETKVTTTTLFKLVVWPHRCRTLEVITSNWMRHKIHIDLFCSHSFRNRFRTIKSWKLLKVNSAALKGLLVYCLKNWQRVA